jgi:hypothetical protein
VLVSGHSAKRSLPSACQWAFSQEVFAECRIQGTRQSVFLNLKNLCRVPDRGHSAKTINLITGPRLAHFFSYVATASHLCYRRRPVLACTTATSLVPEPHRPRPQPRPPPSPPPPASAATSTAPTPVMFALMKFLQVLHINFLQVLYRAVLERETIMKSIVFYVIKVFTHKYSISYVL